MSQTPFKVEPPRGAGGYVARWDAPDGGGIATESDSLAGLDAMITDAAGGYFEPDQRPRRVRWRSPL